MLVLLAIIEDCDGCNCDNNSLDNTLCMIPRQTNSLGKPRLEMTHE